MPPVLFYTGLVVFLLVYEDRNDGHYQWKRQYDHLSGNAIQGLLAFGSSRSFADAVYQLYDWAGGRPVTKITPNAASAPAAPVEEKKKYDEFRLPPANKSFSRVMAYLLTGQVWPDTQISVARLPTTKAEPSK